MGSLSYVHWIISLSIFGALGFGIYTFIRWATGKEKPRK